MIDALVFDFDGVIIDTETPDYELWSEEFRAHGVELDRAMWSQIIGGSPDGFDVYGHLDTLTGGGVDVASIGRRRRQRYLEMVEASPLLPGVLDYLTQAEQLGLKVGVASSSNNDWVEGHLRRRDLLGYVDAVTTRDDVANVKPDPELFLTAVARLSSKPERAVAIEDSANGVTAAKRAGMFCVVVPNPMTRDLPIDHADLRLETLADMELAELLRRAAAALEGIHDS